VTSFSLPFYRQSPSGDGVKYTLLALCRRGMAFFIHFYILLGVVVLFLLLPLLKKVVFYFNLDLNIYPYSKDSLQITMAGKKQRKDIISQQFLTYILHGTKKVRLVKLQEIALYLDSGIHLVIVGKTMVFSSEAKKHTMNI
jgi:hypothetical protein